MQDFLIAARIFHFTATISLAGIFGFVCLIAGPALRRGGVAAAALGRWRRRLGALAWASLVLAFVSGAAWLVAVAAEMSGQPLGLALVQGVVPIVVTSTQFGTDWLVRLGLAVPIGLCLLAPQRRRRVAGIIAWAGFGFAVALLVSLAWAGHGAATPGAPGDLHLAADILHLFGAGMWLGTLPPLALLLVEARRAGPPAGQARGLKAHPHDLSLSSGRASRGPGGSRGDPNHADWAAVAREVARRFSVVAITSVSVLLAGGAVNTWFLAGTVPALVGTEYGRLLLGKVALFVTMLLIAAVNLLRLTPRLEAAAGPVLSRTIAQLRRNALFETSLGLGVLVLVGILGILPPGLHTEPGWPFPFRLDVAALATGAKILLVLLAVLFCLGAVAAVAAAAAGHYRRAAAAAAGLALCLVVAWLPLRPAVEPAYPTSFYAPAKPYAAPSIAEGAAVYGANCALCHGTVGRGDGPAAAGLPIRPANLTEPHLFAHSPGDLFWWVSHGRANGVMPGFAKVLTPSRRWDVINFIRARAAGDLARQVGPTVSTAAAYPVPDFAFELGGAQQTLRRVLEKGPVLLVLFTPPAPALLLRQLAAAAPRLAAASLHVIAVGLRPPAQNAAEGKAPPFVVGVSPAVRAALSLFRPPGESGASELMLDRNGDVRVRWNTNTPGGLAPPATLVADAERVARIAVIAPSHAGHTR